MKITRNGMEIELTSGELREAFLEQQRVYQLEDARGHLNYFLFGIPYAEECTATKILMCREKYGVEYPDLFDETSSQYILDQIVEDYNASCDCNVAENDSYEGVIDRLMRQLEKDNKNSGFIPLINDSFLSHIELWNNEEYYLEPGLLETEEDHLNLYIPITFDICEALNIPDIDDDLINMYIDYFPESKNIRMIVCYMTPTDDFSFEVALSKEQKDIIIKALNEQSRVAYGYELDSLAEHERAQMANLDEANMNLSK